MTGRGQEDAASRKVRASRGGRANEAGSLYRSGVAAYLAAHGLAGRGVEAAGYLPGGSAPVALSFETGEAVDDIRCVLANDSTLRLQAKRACGADDHLSATVAQWTGQVEDLRSGDKIGLATAEPKGPVKDLGAALDRYKRSVPGSMLPGEKRALAAVTDRFPAGTSAQTADRVLDAAVVMAVAVSCSSDEGFRSVANLLDGTVVPVGSGSAAIAVLQRAFQVQAVAGTGSDIDDWLQTLAEAGLPVFPDADGPAGPRRRAELNAVAAYRARLAARDGVLEYSLVADDLPPMTYSPLADSLRVVVPGHGDSAFLATARRWPRMLLTGLPGMGKSTALEQAAARWAADGCAPLPVLVPLREVARRNPRSAAEITLSILIEVATVAVPEHEQVPLRRVLLQAAASGEAVLLLDGLDECRDHRAVVADGLAAVTRDVSPDTGIILTTRDSGLQASVRLKLPEARLTEPAWLTSVLNQLLRHAADYRIPDADRDQWVRQRFQQLEELLSSHRDLCRIPLFAVLLTLLLARPASKTLPTGRARLLAEAVRDAVERWELRRLSETDSRRDMHGDQLLDGYGEIAHTLLNGPSGGSAGTVNAALESMLAKDWGLAPAEARARARDIRWFWDDHVGVFVTSAGTGNVEPRSRVFAEIGDAMWAASRQEPATWRAWLDSALTDESHREPVVLAAALSAEIATGLIQDAAQATDRAVRSRALMWAADAILDGAQPPVEPLTILIRTLTEAATSPGADADIPGGMERLHTRASRPGWQFMLSAATLPLPPTLRDQRDHALARFALETDERAILEALAALADAEADASGMLEPAQEAAIHRLLSLPIPERKSASAEPPATSGQGYRRSHVKLLPGHRQAAAQSAKYVAQLGQDAADAIYRITHRGPVGDYWRVQAQLTALGFEDPEPTRGLKRAYSSLQEWDMWAAWDAFFAAAAAPSAPRLLTSAERWRYPNIATLDDVLDANNVTIDALNLAVTTEQPLLSGCIRAAAHAADLDTPGLCAEANAILDDWSDGNREVIDVIFAPSSAPSPAYDAARIDPQDTNVLIEALGATSEWLSDIAREILATAANPLIAQRAAGRIPQIPPDRRPNAAVVAIANDPNPPEAAARLLGGKDPLTRVGAAFAAEILAKSGSPEAWISVLLNARADDDLLVRLAAGADAAVAESAAYWSCADCSQANEMSLRKCISCGQETRPSPSR